MSDLTLGIIYAIKRSDKPWDKAVAEYMSKYSGSPEEEYGEFNLYTILKNAYFDYIETCDKPHVEIRQLINMMEGFPMYSYAHHFASCLLLTRVKADGHFVNGFRD